MITFNSNELKFNNDGVMTPLPYFSNATASSLDARLTSAETNITALQSGKMDEWTLLWTNASPSSSFSPQSISLDLSQYRFCLLRISINTTYYTFVLSYIVEKNMGSLLLAPQYESGNVCYQRNVTGFDNNGMSFAEGIRNGATNNTILVPYQIYGIK